MNKNDIIELDITTIAEDGSGIGRFDGMVVFCRGLLPGEHGSVQIIKVTKSYAIGKMLSISDPVSPHRMDPPVCRNFTKGCGGCTFCHVDYQEQLNYKRQHIADCIARIGGFSNVDILPVVPAEFPKFYRNKSIYPFSQNSSGDVICGFYAQNSHRVVPIEKEERCMIENDMCCKIRRVTFDFISQRRTSIYNESTGKGIMRSLMVRTNHRGTPEAMIVLSINADKMPHLQDYINTVTAACPYVSSIYICTNKKDTNVVLDGSFRHVYGKMTIQDTIGDFEGAPSFEISPLSFYQVNPLQTEKLYDVVYRLLPAAPKLIYDIYCGTGTIGIYLAVRAADVRPQLTGVEAVPSAVADAQKNAAAAGISNAEFFCGDAAEVTPKVMAKYGTPSVVVLDPPRKGCDAALIQTVLSAKADRVIYVSCDPATLARDLKLLCETNYEIKCVQPVDMFPQSGHVETVALIQRKLCRNP